MKSWENVLVSGVRTQVTSHHLKTWKREHWAQFYCRYVETKITRETQKPSRCKNFRFCQIFLCWSLWFYDLIMVGSQFYAEEWWNRVEGVVGSCAKIGLINFLFMQLSQPLLRNLQSLCCCTQWTSWISFLWIFCPRFMIFDMIFVGTVQMMTTMLQLETNITVALSVAWLETRVRNLK